jgi:hypothetical protein
VQEDNTLQSSRQNSKEFESADRTVSERVVYLLGWQAREGQGVIALIVRGFIRFLIVIYFSLSSTNRYKKV